MSVIRNYDIQCKLAAPETTAAYHSMHQQQLAATTSVERTAAHHTIHDQHCVLFSTQHDQQTYQQQIGRCYSQHGKSAHLGTISTGFKGVYHRFAPKPLCYHSHKLE